MNETKKAKMLQSQSPWNPCVSKKVMSTIAISTLLLGAGLIGTAHAQTFVGCDASCPPQGYESDSSHLCIGETIDDVGAFRAHEICHPSVLPEVLADGADGNSVSLSQFRKKGYVTVVANYYTGCEAGRRESGVYAALAQKIYDETVNSYYGAKVHFVTSLKGGGNCEQWADIYQSDAAGLGILDEGEKPTTMPLTVADQSYALRDHLFTAPYPHPSYIILDQNLKVSHKTVGPCCGYSGYYDCTDEVALGLVDSLTEKIFEVYNAQVGEMKAEIQATTTAAPTIDAATVTTPTTATPTTTPTATPISTSCGMSGEFSEWSSCSKTCGDGGTRFRYKMERSTSSSSPVQSEPCPQEVRSTLPVCSEQCVPEFKSSDQNSVLNLASVLSAASGFDSPRDLAFHPTPGLHLGDYSEGRSFDPSAGGEELWVANGNNHSISVVTSFGTESQSTFSRQDRGYYHYMANVTALAFNTVPNTVSKREISQETYNFFAVCNDNRNTYLDSKEPNFFMGPTLYDSDPGKGNTVNRLGNACHPSEECFFLHADMLHESPQCIGMTHDPEIETAYGTVYWAFDSTGSDPNDDDGVGQLVRFDFQQPHGPGSMDHSIASVRRYPEIELRRGSRNSVHAGMIVHPTRRVLYISNPGEGTIIAVNADSGRFSRTAREEYPIFSNRLPSFEYSIFECAERDVFASGLVEPAGLALSLDGERLFVAERGGRIIALEVDSGVVLASMDVSRGGRYTAIGGLVVSPTSGKLYFVDMEANEVVYVDADVFNESCEYVSRTNKDFVDEVEDARLMLDSVCGKGVFSLDKDYTCEVDGTIPNGTLFEQVHTDGYASDNPEVQGMAGMDASAALLANRTDCGPESDLNFDALLLGGYYCHTCLPGNQGSSCDAGGTCKNVQWLGYTCDNEFFVSYDASSSSLVLSNLHANTTHVAGEKPVVLRRGTTYRFTVQTGVDYPVMIHTLPKFPDLPLNSVSLKSTTPNDGVTAGPIIVTVDDTTPEALYLTSPSTESILIDVGQSSYTPNTPPGTPQGDVGLKTKSFAMRSSWLGSGFVVLSVVSSCILTWSFL